MTGSAPYQAFISYTRDDNDDHDQVVDRLKKELSGRFAASTGDDLEIFLDRDSIGWGENWRAKIADAVQGSTLFIPIITMRFFRSEMCREELSLFHAAAARRHAADLVLPIVLAGADQIRSNHRDELVRTIADLNYQSIATEFDAGYQSAAWKTRIGTLVIELRDALTKVEDSLNNSPITIAPPSAAADVSTDEVNVTEIDESIVSSHMDELIEGLTSLFEDFAAVSDALEERTAGRDLAKLTSGQRSFFFGALAEELAQPSAKLGSAASDLEGKARRLDAELRAFLDELVAADPEHGRQSIVDLQQSAGSTFDGVGAMFNDLEDMQGSLRVAALASVKLRRAITPLGTGLTAIGVILGILASWKDLSPA